MSNNRLFLFFVCVIAVFFIYDACLNTYHNSLLRKLEQRNDELVDTLVQRLNLEDLVEKEPTGIFAIMDFVCDHGGTALDEEAITELFTRILDRTGYDWFLSDGTLFLRIDKHEVLIDTNKAWRVSYDIDALSYFVTVK
jgi:hypothetical protein